MTDGRIRQAAAAFQDNWRVPNLRYAQLSFGSAFAAEWALTVGLAILAFRTGGATAVGVVAMARMLPSVLVAPLISGVVDRHRRERVLLAVCLVRGAALAGAALSVAVLDLAWPAYACAALATLAHTLYRPAHSALLPSLCKTPAALTSANVVAACSTPSAPSSAPSRPGPWSRSSMCRGSSPGRPWPRGGPVG